MKRKHAVAAFAHVTIWHVLLLAGLFRLLTFALLPYQDFPDARSFTNAGRALMSTGQMQPGVDLYMPLYPIWNFLWGGGWGVKFGDIILSTAMVAAVWKLSLLLLRDNTAAMMAALAATVYPHFLFFAVSGLTETSFTLLVVAAFIALYRGRFFTGSVLLVLSILVRPAIDLLSPLLIFWFAAVVHRHSIPDSARRVVVYFLTYIALMSPWWAHNYARYGEFVRLTLGDGVVLYSGNNPLNQSGGGVGYLDDPTHDMDIEPFLRIADPVERNEALKHAGWDFIRENPCRFIELAGVKFVRFWRLWPYAPEYSRPEIVVVSLLSYGILLSLAIIFLFREATKRWRELSPILGFAGFLMLVHMVTIGSIRYRFPLEPFVIIFGAYAATDMMRRIGVTRRLMERTFGHPAVGH